MRRFALMILLAAIACPVSTSAASWHAFSSKKLGLSFHYPASWHVAYRPKFKQVSVAYVRRSAYSLTVSILGTKTEGTLPQTLQRVIHDQRAIGNAAFAQIRWLPTRLGSAPALVGVAKPPKGSSITLSSEIYLAQWRSRLYEIIAVAYGKPPPSRLKRFPQIYRKILATWRFI
jgi:hypothetical protein